MNCTLHTCVNRSREVKYRREELRDKGREGAASNDKGRDWSDVDLYVLLEQGWFFMELGQDDATSKICHSLRGI